MYDCNHPFCPECNVKYKASETLLCRDDNHPVKEGAYKGCFPSWHECPKRHRIPGSEGYLDLGHGPFCGGPRERRA